MLLRSFSGAVRDYQMLTPSGLIAPLGAEKKRHDEQAEVEQADKKKEVLISLREGLVDECVGEQ